MSLRSSLSFVLFSASCLGAAGLFAAEPVWTAKPGPWGELEVRTVYLEPPEALLALVAKPTKVTRWTFEQTTPGGVREIMARANVPAEVIERLISPVRMAASGNSVVILPELSDLQAIGPEARGALYLELAKHAANEYQRDPVFILGGDVDDWLQGVTLTPAQQALFRKLLWRRGAALVFSDVQALLSLASSDEELTSVFRAITRVRSLVVELRLPLTTDRQAFIDYWSAGQTDAPRLAFVRAITQRRARQTVDITHFLPSIFRQRTYTFPEMDLGLKGRFPDCHWTSLNFFNLTSNDVFLDPRLASEHLLKNYEVVDPPYRFGDVLCFLEEAEGLHTCVYVADDIVLTKNGDSILAAWALMQLKDVDSIYRRSPAARVQGYRLKR